MSKRRMVAAACFVAVSTSALALSSGPRGVASFVGLNAGTESPPREGQRMARSPAAFSSEATGSAENGSDPQAANPPEHVIYGLLFREVTTFKKLAGEKESKGNDGSFLRKHHKERLKLEDAEAEALARIAEETDREARKLDREARKLIDGERARHREGRLREGEGLPAPPAALGALQQRRAAVVLKGRDDLRVALGEDKFKRFDESVRKGVASKMRPVQGLARPQSPGLAN